MRQVFRLMDMPDRVIAFDALPESLLEGLELFDCSKLPRDWREFIGVREKHIKVKPERDPISNQMMTFPPLVQKAPYAYLIDREINHDKERWGEIETYVKRNAPKDFRLMDKLVDMAKPMASDAHTELTLEPDDVIVIPMPVDVKEIEEEAAPVSLAQDADLHCSLCDKTFSSKQALRMHKMKKHEEAVST